jgi:hypothetical protein
MGLILKCIEYEKWPGADGGSEKGGSAARYFRM